MSLTDDDLDYAFEATWTTEELEVARKLSVALKEDRAASRTWDLARYERMAAGLLPPGADYAEASRYRVLRRAEGIANGQVEDDV